MYSKTVDFKYFLPITKAYEENGEWYVEGIASGTRKDLDGQAMSREVLEKFVQSLPLPLTDGHVQTGPIMGDLGEVVFGEVMDDTDNSLFVRSRVDQDNPSVQYMVKSIHKGKKFAFSIEGTTPVIKTMWDEQSQSFVDRYIDLTPKAISVTTKPSYTPSLLEVVAKAVKKAQVVQKSEINNLNNTNIMEKTKPETKEVEKTQEVTPTQTEAKSETTETKPEETTQTTETVEVKPEETTVETKSEETTTAPVETQSEVEEKPEAKEEVTVEKSSNAKSEDQTDVAEELQTKQGADVIAYFEKCMGMLQKTMEAINSMTSALATVKTAQEDMAKSYKGQELVLKSFHSDIEALKDMPLQKKSLVVKAQTFEERTKPTWKDVAANIVGS